MSHSVNYFISFSYNFLNFLLCAPTAANNEISCLVCQMILSECCFQTVIKWTAFNENTTLYYFNDFKTGVFAIGSSQPSERMSSCRKHIQASHRRNNKTY